MASSISDILSTIQSGVIALNNLAAQVKGSFTAINNKFMTIISPFFTGNMIGTNTAGGGVNLILTGDGGTTPKKYLRVTAGSFFIVNDADTIAILTLTDAGELSWVGSAWTAYTPTVTITGGAGTASGYYKVHGKTLHVKATITITVNGTSLAWTAPAGMVFATGSAYVFGREQAVNGFMWSGVCTPTTGTVSCQRYDNNAAVTAGFVFVFTGSVEIV